MPAGLSAPPTVTPSKDPTGQALAAALDALDSSTHGCTPPGLGLPLRLLAREVYGRVVERAGADAVALITGEEKIKPKSPRYWVATVEAMPRDLNLSFVAVDEVQLASDFDRGHVFTDRILNRRDAYR